MDSFLLTVLLYWYWHWLQDLQANKDQFDPFGRLNCAGSLKIIVIILSISQSIDLGKVRKKCVFLTAFLLLFFKCNDDSFIHSFAVWLFTCLLNTNTVRTVHYLYWAWVSIEFGFACFFLASWLRAFSTSCFQNFCPTEKTTLGQRQDNKEQKKTHKKTPHYSYHLHLLSNLFLIQDTHTITWIYTAHSYQIEIELLPLRYSTLDQSRFSQLKKERKREKGRRRRHSQLKRILQRNTVRYYCTTDINHYLRCQ